MNYIYAICLVIFLLLSIIILFFIIKKSILLHQNRIKWNKIQLPELINESKFIFSDGKTTEILKSNFDDSDNKIYLFIHDIYGINKKTKEYIKNSNKNIITFLQFGFMDNEYNKNFALNHSQINEFIFFLKQKYLKHEVILISEGFSCLYMKPFIKQNYKILFLNPILNVRYLDLSFFKVLSFNLPYISRLKSKLNFEFKLKKLMNIKDNNDIIFKCNYLYFYRCYKSIKKFRLKNNDNFVVFQSINSFFYSENKTRKKIQNIKIINNDLNVHSISSINFFNQIIDIL